MFDLFHSRGIESPPPVELAPFVFPPINGAEMGWGVAGKRVSGDFYDAIRVGSDRILIGLLNVGTHGEDNSPILGTAQQIFRDDGAQLFSAADLNESLALTELSLRLNRGLMAAAGGVCSCPAFLVCYHERFGTLCYTNAGHTSGLLRDSRGIAELGPTGLPLGLFSHATLDAPTAGMEEGSCLLLVSIGVVKFSSDGGQSGLDRIKDLFQAADLTSAQELCTSILSATAAEGANTFLRDDRTALALLRTA